MRIYIIQILQPINVILDLCLPQEVAPSLKGRPVLPVLHPGQVGVAGDDAGANNLSVLHKHITSTLRIYILSKPRVREISKKFGR